MAMIYYYIMLAISLVLVVIYSFIFHKHFDANLTILCVLVPIINMGFVLMGNATVIEEALIALRITYLGGCFLLVSAMFLIFNTCGIPLKPWQRMIFIIISTLIYVSTLTIGHNDMFYVGMPDLAYYEGAAYITNKHYGYMHTVFYVMVIIYYAITIGVIIYSFFKKKQVPRLILGLIVIAVTVALIGFFGGRFITKEVELLPVTYNLGMIIYLIIASRLRLYDATDSVSESIVQKGDTGFISFDNKMRYLDSNLTAKNMIPKLNDLVVDHYINNNEWLKDTFLSLVEEYELDNNKNTKLIEKEDKIFLIRLNRLLIGKFNRGYQFLVTDDTANQQYIKLIQNYNTELEKEVASKTKSIVEMQEKLVLGMATMIEGRDNSTGGHIKRTSDCIRILVEEIKKDNSLNLSEEFMNDLIKAAPMHDLGKITIDDKILRKPGKFTDEEYEIMKTHSEEGARIVRQILEGTDDKMFMNIAVNVAHYHHEKWDGTGYPHRLIKEEIPIEARIMAIADVYDALVSKRVYKEKFSFEEANNIIISSMGKHFDPNLEKYYVAARSKLEAYYANLDK